MAASITGTFTIIDRASATMRKMEKQAVKTMTAIEAVGAAQDKAAVTSRKHGDESDRMTRVMRSTEAQTKRSTRAHGDHETSMRRSSRASSDLTSRLGRLGAALGGISKVLMVLKFAAVAAGVATLAQAIGTLAGGAVALVPALAQAGGAIAALPGVIAAAVQGVAVFKLALGGVGDALKAGMQVQQQSARVAQDTADAHRTAAHSVASAEYNLMQAQRGVTDAQVSLTQARRDAVRSLTDLRLAALGADLAQQRSGLALREARQQLAQAAVNPGTTAMEMQGLQLSVREAQLSVRQARVDRNRADVDNRRSQSRGVAGNQQVIQSQRAVADAVHGVGEATFAMAEAQRELTRSQSQGVSEVDQYRQAMKQLGPEAQHFVRHVISLRKEFLSIRNAGAGAMFPGLDDALTSSTRAIPMARRIAKRTGGVIGQETARAARRFTSKGRLSDLGSLGGQNATVLSRMLRGTSNLSAALVDLMVAAEPFTDWLTHTIYMGTEWVAKWARAQRTTGDFARRLDGTKDRLKQFGGMLKDVGTIIHNVSDAAKPLGDRLWSGAAKGLDNLAATTNRKGPQMQAWFDKLYTPLHEMGQLTKDLGAAWARLTVDPSFTRSIEALRRAVPGIEDLLTKSAGMSPALIGLLDTIARLLGDLPFSPLERMLRALTTVADVVDRLVSTVPGLGNAIAGILMISLLSKSVSLTGRLLNNWRNLFQVWGGGGGRGGGRGGGPGGAGGMLGPTIGGGGGGGGRTRGRGVRGMFGDARAAGQLEREAAVAGGAGRARGALAFLRGGALGGEAGGGLAAVGMTGLRAAGKFALPVTAALGAMDFLGTPGTLGERAQATLSGASFGLIHGPQLGAESRQVGQQKAGTVVGRGLGATNARISELRRQLGETHTVRTPVYAGRAGVASSGRATHQNVVTGADRRRREAELKALTGAQGGLERQHAGALTGRYADIFSVYQGGNAGQRRTGRGRIAQGFQQDFREASQVGKRELSNGVAQWIAVLSKGDKSQRRMARSLTASVKDSWASMGRHIEVVNGQVLGGSQKEWKGIAKALSDPVEKARQDVSRGFTSMQRTAIGSLKAMGYNDNQAKAIIKGLEGGSAYAAMDAKNGPTGTGQRWSSSDKQVAAMHGFGDGWGRPSGTGDGPGGKATGAGGGGAPNLMGAHAGLSKYANAGAPFGLHVTSGSRPGAITNAGNVSFHASGNAIDMGNGRGPDAEKMAFAQMMVSRYGSQLEELIYSPLGFSIKNGKKVAPYAVADHYDHVHVADTAPGGGGGGLGGGKPMTMPDMVVAPKLRGGGVAGAMGNAALAAAAAGLNKRLNIAGGGSGSSSGGGGFDFEPGGATLGKGWHFAGAKGSKPWSEAAVAALAASVGLPGKVFGQIAHGESGFDPFVQQRDPGDGNVGYGFWQLTPHAWGRGSAAMKKFTSLGGTSGMLDVHNQALMAKYLYDAAGHSISPWYGTQYVGKGDGIGWGGWNAKGGQFSVDRPTLFGAGESGKETVTITPAGKSGGSRPTIHVTIEKIEYHRKGDIKKAIQEEMRALTDDIELVGS